MLLLSMLWCNLCIAGTVHLEYQNWDGKNGYQDAQAVQLAVGEDLNKKINADVRLTTINFDSGAVSSSLEFGLTPKIPLTDSLNFYTRVSAGHAFKSTGNTQYYGVEPGMIYKLNNLVTIRAAHRFRGGFEENSGFETQTSRLWTIFNITPKNFIFIRYDRMRGDYDMDSINTALGIRF